MSIENRLSSVASPTTSRQPLSDIRLNTSQQPTPFSTPRHRKIARQPATTPTSTTGTQIWPRIGQAIDSKILADATKQIFGYLPRSWQAKVTEKVLEGNDVIAIAGTGAGKSLIFAMLAIAAELAGFEGIIMVICPLKSLQKDQVSPFKRIPVKKHTKKCLILGEKIQQHAHHFIVK